MPLSEQEQRLLDEMERHLMRNDADVVSAPRDGRSLSYRNIVYGTILVLLGLGGLIVGVSQQWIVVGVIGFVVMLAGLMLTWRQAGAAITMYLAAGAIGLPVFAGGASTLALVGPSAGFLIGFLPAAMLTAALKGRADTSTPLRAVATVSRYLLAAFTGCVVLDYALGFIVQSALTGLSIKVVAIASMGFIIGDIIKVCVASLAAAGLTRLDR